MANETQRPHDSRKELELSRIKCVRRRGLIGEIIVSLLFISPSHLRDPCLPLHVN